ncbi:MAG: TMEM165/GDT1 family protein [Alphaproteobacteria bacterium]
MFQFASIFAVILAAELGDKTQLAILLFAANRQLSPTLVFAAAALALLVATGLAVIVGNLAARYLEFLPLKLIAGFGFLLIGAWTMFEHFRATA